MSALLRRLRRIKSWPNRLHHLADVVLRRDRGLDRFRLRWWLETNPWVAAEIWLESWHHRWDDDQDVELVDLVHDGVFDADLEWLADGGRWDNDLTVLMFQLWHALAHSYGLQDACELVCTTCGSPFVYERAPLEDDGDGKRFNPDTPSRCLGCGRRRGDWPEPTDESGELPF